MHSTHTSSATTSTQAALAFSLRLARAHTTLMRRLDNALGNQCGISFGDFQILLYLNNATAGRLRRIDLAERLSLTASGVTRSLIPLEKIGLVSRQSDSRDARIAYAVITDSGRTLLHHAVPTAEMISDEALKEQTPQALASLSETLAGIAGMNLSNS